MDESKRVRDVMTREYVGVSEADPVDDVVGLMHDEGVGSALVLHGSEPVGILTEWDVLAHVATGGDASTAGNLMTEPVVTIEADRQLPEAVRTFARENIRRLPAVEDGEVVGLLTARDVIASAAAAAPDRAAGEAPGDAVAGPAAQASSEGTIGAGGGAEAGTPTATAATQAASEQAICEECGTLTRDLQPVNGAVVCPDCRSV
jgi:CBS domain-containing protein